MTLAIQSYEVVDGVPSKMVVLTDGARFIIEVRDDSASLVFPTRFTFQAFLDHAWSGYDNSSMCFAFAQAKDENGDLIVLEDQEAKEVWRHWPTDEPTPIFVRFDFDDDISYTWQADGSILNTAMPAMGFMFCRFDSKKITRLLIEAGVEDVVGVTLELMCHIEELATRLS